MKKLKGKSKKRIEVQKKLVILTILSKKQLLKVEVVKISSIENCTQDSYFKKSV